MVALCVGDIVDHPQVVRFVSCFISEGLLGEVRSGLLKGAD